MGGVLPSSGSVAGTWKRPARAPPLGQTPLFEKHCVEDRAVVNPEAVGPSLGPVLPAALGSRGAQGLEKGELGGRPERTLRGTTGARGLREHAEERTAAGRARPAGMAAGAAAAGPGVAIPVELRRERRLVCVEYPGMVRDVSKMLSTLGGEEGVSRVRTGESGPRGRDRVVGLRPGAGPPGGNGVVSLATEP